MERLVPFQGALVGAGCLGLLVGILVLRPLLRRVMTERGWWAQIGAAATSVTLLFPVVATLFAQTEHFRTRQLTEVGSPAFREPPMSEDAFRAIRGALHPGESWATVTRLGHCADIDLVAFYWLAFRLVPNPPDCAAPDVELYLKRSPPPGSVVVARGKDYWVVRR